MAKNIAIVLLLLLLSASLFLILEARPPGTAATNEKTVTVRIKGGSSGSGRGIGGRSGRKPGRPVGGSSRSGGGNDGSLKAGGGRLLPRPGRTTPLIPGQTGPRTSSDTRHESNAVNAAYSSSLVFFLLITALWVLFIEI
ncbi:hypothetical protein HPP92_001105 [Vanilla planifolia]|uniref:Glycine-rich protein n=1 Tax=Vanilla planifolia TaxID=51239 RepID=A0A835RR47_VANPL|nr:hypothetical protein HPP92_001105 [Vanilla planifolia]